MTRYCSLRFFPVKKSNRYLPVIVSYCSKLVNLTRRDVAVAARRTRSAALITLMHLKINQGRATIKPIDSHCLLIYCSFIVEVEFPVLNRFLGLGLIFLSLLIIQMVSSCVDFI